MTVMEAVDDTARLMGERWGKAMQPQVIDRRYGIQVGIPSSSGGEIWCAPSEAHIVGAIAVGSCDYHHWRDGREIWQGRIRRGWLGIEPAGSSVRGIAAGSLQAVHLYVPHTELIRRAARNNMRRADRLSVIDPRTGDDPQMESLMLCLAEATSGTGSPSRLYFDSLVDAILNRILMCWSTLEGTIARGGLAGWQVKRACEAMEAALASDVGLEELADLVGLSATHFSRAFKQSTGVAPFHWLAERRIDKAKSLLADSGAALAEIALDCGFAAQPQFTTAFRRATGMTPGRWRRERLS